MLYYYATRLHAFTLSLLFTLSLFADYAFFFHAAVAMPSIAMPDAFRH